MSSSVRPVCPTSVYRRVHWLCWDIPLSISFRREKLFISPCTSGALTTMPAAAWLFKLGLTWHSARSRVWVFAALCVHARIRGIDCESPVFLPPCCRRASCGRWRPLSFPSRRHTGPRSPQSVARHPPWTQHLTHGGKSISHACRRVPQGTRWVTKSRYDTLWQRVVVVSRGRRAVLGVHPHHGHLGSVAQAQNWDFHHSNVAFDPRLADAVLDLRETDDGL